MDFSFVEKIRQMVLSQVWMVENLEENGDLLSCLY